eukprot:m.150302 g.150302  ORF g.150302 m.150302 type:complete len:96 (-) comp15025_c0_seq4:7-294(-)
MNPPCGFLGGGFSKSSRSTGVNGGGTDGRLGVDMIIIGFLTQKTPYSYISNTISDIKTLPYLLQLPGFLTQWTYSSIQHLTRLSIQTSRSNVAAV